MKKALVASGLIVGLKYAALANGGAWQTGVPGTGSAAASDKGQSTNVVIENEMLKIDLHPEYAAVDVHYRMHNTGAKVQQDFFFPVERWEKQSGEETNEPADLDHFLIRVDSTELKWVNVPESKQELRSGAEWNQPISVIKAWKKSVIPFER